MQQQLNSLKVLVVSGISLMVGMSLMSKDNIKTSTHLRDKVVSKTITPPSIQMYRNIEKYADSFNIPKRYAYGIAYRETRYNGPFHWKYNHAQTSSASTPAVGPMQVKVNTARHVNHDEVNEDRLRNDIEYNVMTSMKLLRKLKNKHGDWKRTFGAYHTGGPCVDNYALEVYNHKINWK